MERLYISILDWILYNPVDLKIGLYVITGLNLVCASVLYGHLCLLRRRFLSVLIQCSKNGLYTVEEVNYIHNQYLSGEYDLPKIKYTLKTGLLDL